MRAQLLLAGWIGVILLGNCNAAAQEGAKVPTVETDTVKMVSGENPRRYVGTLESIEHVDIMPRVTGNLLKIHFTEGSIVRKGALLYELEDTTYRAAVEKLKAEKESLEAAFAYARKEFTRSDTLLRSKAVAVSTHDKSVLDIDSAQANVKQLKASLLDAENTLSYTKIYAPITGRIGKSAFTEGNLITPQGGKLTDIEMTAPIYVRFSISERVFRRDFGGSAGIRTKALVRIQLADGLLYGETARVSLIDNKISTSTNTITLWAVFQNADGELIPGGFVSVLLSRESNRKLPAVVPSALVADENGYLVYVLDAENRVSARRVRTGALADGLQIVTEGLKGTERIVSGGTNKVRPGMTVAPVPAERAK